MGWLLVRILCWIPLEEVLLFTAWSSEVASLISKQPMNCRVFPLCRRLETMSWKSVTGGSDAFNAVLRFALGLCAVGGRTEYQSVRGVRCVMVALLDGAWLRSVRLCGQGRLSDVIDSSQSCTYPRISP